MSRSQESWDEFIQIIQAELHPEQRNNPPPKPNNQPYRQSKPTFADGRVPMFGVHFVLIVGITLVCTQVCRLLPDELLLISGIIHGANVVVIIAIMLGYGAKCWQMLYWVLTHKYISIMANNSHGCALHKNTVVQLACSIVLYLVYMYNTRNTRLPSIGYTIVVWICVCVVLVSMWPGGWQLANIGNMGQCWVLIGYYVLGWCYSRMTNQIQKEYVSTSSRIDSIMDGILKWLKIKPELETPTHSSYESYRKIVWLSLSLFAILCIIDQCRKHCLWMLIWLLAVVFGNGTTHSIAYLKTRHTNIMVAWFVSMVGQWAVTLYQGSTPQSTFMFHLTMLISMLIIYLHISLQYHLHFQSSPQLSTICNLTLINFTIPKHSHPHKDKPYNQSLSQIIMNLRLMLVAQSAIAYNVYTYVYYYHSSRISNNSQEENRFYGSWGHDRALCSKAGVGYAIMVVFMAVLAKLVMRDNQNLRNKIPTKKQKINKFMVAYMVLCWLFYFHQLRTSFAGNLRNILQYTPISLILPAGTNIDLYYKLNYHLHNCSTSNSPYVLLLFILATTTYLICYIRFNTDHINTRYSNFLIWTYRVCIFAMYVAALALVNQCRCGEIGWLVAWVLAATVLLLAKNSTVK